MYVPFPGFERVFQSVLALNSAWQVNVDRELAAAATASGADRFERTLDLYASAIGRLSRTQNLDVITCCLPHDVLTKCWSITRRLTSGERQQLKSAKRSDQKQLSFEGLWSTDDTREELLQRDFRRALKARAMAANIPIQIATPYLFDDGLASQDPATRAWNSSVALSTRPEGSPGEFVLMDRQPVLWGSVSTT